MEFEIKRIITNEYFNGNVPFDLNEMEQFIAERLHKISFGESVVKYFWGFEVYKFNGRFAQFFSDNIESWKHSKKWLVTNSHFDWDKIRDLDNYDFIELMKSELIKSIERVNGMKRKPKNFNQKEFRDTIENILNDYKKIKNRA